MAKKKVEVNLTKEFFNALDEIEKEYRISKESMIESIQSGLSAAYKKENSEPRNVNVLISETTQSIHVFASQVVVENYDDVEDDATQICLEDAQLIDEKYQVGDTVVEDITPINFSRIAAQTAKQVIIQKLNDMRKAIVKDEMQKRTNQILEATIRRVEGDNVYVEMVGSQMEGIMSKRDQVPTEKYKVGDNIKVYIKQIRDSLKGSSQVIVSRSDPRFVSKLFEMEVPEMRVGLVKVKNCVRDAGFRTKISVYSDDPNVDAVGSFIGPKGARVNAVVAELGGEKIDLVEYTADNIEYIARSLSPATVVMVSIDEEQKTAKVIVPDDKLSLAIGKSGVNARLACKLTQWHIDVKPSSSIQLDGDDING